MSGAPAFAPLGVAVIGAGRIGSLHAKHLRGAVDGARLIMVVDADLEVASRAAGGGIEVASDYRAALAHEAVDAVVIASPTDLHGAHLAAAAAAGKAIFCEKPVANGLAPTVAALTSVQDAGVAFQIGFNRRFDPAYAAVGRAVAAGEIGVVELFRSQSSDPGPSPEAYIAASGGFYRDSVIHDIDTARFVAGEVRRVTALGRVLVDDVYRRHDDIDTSVVTLEFAGGGLGVLMNSRRTLYGHDLRLEVHGSRGKMVAEDERATKVWRYDQAGVHGDFYYFFLERFKDAYRLELQAFVDAVTAGTTPSPGVSDAVESLRVAEAAGRSLLEGRPVDLEEIAVGTRGSAP
ncbi:MAG TPA: inositol 2-dehydrogenase [Trueperaceae bacterium]|nr:inositol 2-dehydrogenase [Trueperaceae bacterium]